jgi:mycothione reductase
VHRGPRVLTAEDGEISGAFTDLARARFDLRLESTVVAAERSGSAWRLTVEGPDGTSCIDTDAVLLAVGRVPNTDLLDAAAGGLPTHDDGRLVVDAQQRTPVTGVWALGDISSDHQLKHVANHEMRVVKHNLTHPGAPVESDHRYVPHAVFSHPQLAAVGHTQEQLEAAGRPFHAATQRFGDVAFGWALEDTSGICKVIVDPDTLEILGAHLMGPMSSTLVQPLIQAMQFGQRADDIAKKQYWIHPALTEVIENALLGAIES